MSSLSEINKLCYRTLIASLLCVIGFLLMIFLFTFLINTDQNDRCKVSDDIIVFRHIGQDDIYQKGVNDALHAFVLLHLELQLNKEKKTLGEMSGVVKGRLLQSGTK